MPPPSPADAVQRLSLKNREYAHIEDANRGVVLTEIGPRVLTLEAHQTLLKKDKMVELGVRRYCVIKNPVERGGDGHAALDAFGQARLLVGDREVRVGPLAFPLYPGEELEGKIESESVLGVYDAVKLRALTTFEEPVPGAQGGGEVRVRQAGGEQARADREQDARPRADGSGGRVSGRSVGVGHGGARGPRVLHGVVLNTTSTQ